MVLTSEEVNIIVYKYLQESGFRHTSFAFQYESQVEKSSYRDTHIQPGALINIIHKGLQFMEIEAHMNEEGELMECSVPFSLLEPHHCELTGHTFDSEPVKTAKRQRKEEKKQKEREKRARKDDTEDLGKEEVKKENSVKEDEDMEESIATEKEMIPTEISAEDVIVLKGHKSEVFSCAWNPITTCLFASGSGDATARLWNVPEDKEEAIQPIVLNHLPNLNDNKDVTTLDWNPTGTLLVTGSYDGQARIWTQKGQLRFVMAQHKGPIFSLKWNMKGDLVLSGSADTTTIIWDPETGEMKQQFEYHTQAILDVDWMDNTTFASCSSDKTIYVCRLGQTKPIKKWVGHEDEVNAVRWDPSGQYLASCSDDMTCKIWSLSSDQPIQQIKGHTLQIYTLQWAPQKDSRILATASFDASVRLWDALSGTCLYVLNNHTEAVYSISFSPDARLLASGSFDEVLNVWDTKDGSLKKTFKADGGIFEVHFNCINGKFEEHRKVMHTVTVEKEQIIQQANIFLERATVIQTLVASKNKLCMSLESIQAQQTRLTKEIHKKSLRISELKRAIEHKRRMVEQAQGRYDHKKEINNNNEAVIKLWHRTHKMTVGTRRILVKEVASLFELKPGVIEEEEQQQQNAVLMLDHEDRMPFSKRPINLLNNKEDLYICGVTLPTKLIDVSTYPKEEINAPISLVVHMLRLIVHYLGIKLPFKIFQKGIQPYIRLETPNSKLWRNNNKMPLFLDKEDKNLRRFTIGMAMLNYNIAYLCYTQGVRIPLSEVPNTLQSLMACCHAPKLGIRSHALVYKGIRDLEFPIEFDQVWKMTALRYKTQQNADRPWDESQYPSDHVLLYPDSDEEEQIENQETLDKIEPSAMEQSEHWNLVDVMPSFHRGANNGNEGESVFQQAATSFMPGVMSVMESLNQHDPSSFLSRGKKYLR
ncbi:hypothetical protein G6F49_008416 [Rhizopus delemar]|nr:hypothetical protein G6F49_008416 [Rhizopus delemar]